MPDSIVKNVDYEVRRDGDDVDLTVTVEGVGFVRETIPDGTMAGMLGHREVPYTNQFIYNLHISQARHLRDQLDEILRWA
jgi:hypothetical protein